jgi:hypothetical protein
LNDDIEKGELMGEYLRSRRECTLDAMRPTTAAAIRSYIEKYELGDLAASALMSCETASTKQKKGLFGGKAEVILTGVLLTPKWLIWATGKENETPGVLSARLRDIQVQDYEKSSQYRLIPDSGIDISGLRTGTADPASAFIGLGPEPSAQKFRSMLKEAVEAA